MNMTWWAPVLYWFPSFVQLIQNYLVSRQQCSRPLLLWYLVFHIQGLILGPYLFLTFIDDYINQVFLSPGSHLVIYADDILLYCPISSPTDYKLTSTHWLVTISLNRTTCHSTPPNVKQCIFTLNTPTNSSPHLSHLMELSYWNCKYLGHWVTVSTNDYYNTLICLIALVSVFESQ